MNNILSYIESNKYPKEKWKEIVGTSGKYYISSFGRVISGAEKRPSFLQPWIDSKGYEEITIIQNGKKRNLYIHLLVA